MAWGESAWGVLAWGDDLATDITSASSFLPHSFNLSQIDRAVGTPKPRTVWNQFDEHGLILGLSRLQGEPNWEYKRRILDASAHRASSAYRGLIHAITRELGLTLSYPLEINPRRNPDGTFLAADPYIRFDGVWLYLYSDYANDQLDYQIDRFAVGGNYEHIGRLVDLINQSVYFEATLLGDAYTRSMTILNQSNRIQVDAEPLVVSRKNKLRNRHIVSGSEMFSDLGTFVKGVSSVASVTSAGKYHLDNTSGILTSYSEPSRSAAIRYSYVPFPFRPVASSVILHDINSEAFTIKMFEQVLQDDGTYANGLPTELGADVINELMSVTPMYWGV